MNNEKFTPEEWNNEKFTPDEWKIDKYTNAIYILENGRYKTVANTNSINWDGDVWNANANLIAAAPDMYQMLKKIIEFQKANFGGEIKTHLGFVDLANQIEIVLKKARGEE